MELTRDSAKPQTRLPPNNFFCKALEPTFKTETPSHHDKALDETNSVQKQKKEVVKKNHLAMSYFSTLFIGDEMLCMLEEVKTPAFSDGIACNLWANLLDKYCPDDTIGVAQQLTDLVKLELDMNKIQRNLSGACHES